MFRAPCAPHTTCGGRALNRRAPQPDHQAASAASHGVVITAPTAHPYVRHTMTCGTLPGGGRINLDLRLHSASRRCFPAKQKSQKPRTAKDVWTFTALPALLPSHAKQVFSHGQQRTSGPSQRAPRCFPVKQPRPATYAAHDTRSSRDHKLAKRPPAQIRSPRALPARLKDNTRPPARHHRPLRAYKRRRIPRRRPPVGGRGAPAQLQQ